MYALCAVFKKILLVNNIYIYIKTHVPRMKPVYMAQKETHLVSS